MPASMPTRHGGRFTNRAAIRVRETFSRRTIAPFSSRPIICSVFLPVSIPMVRATAASALLGMACPPRALQKPPTDSACRWGREQAGCNDLEIIGLAHLYSAHCRERFLLPGHHGYPRASDLIRDKALEGRKYIKITDATVRPFLHLLNPTRRPRQESFGFCRR